MATITKFPFPVRDVPTPCFLVDLNRVKKNATAMIGRCQQIGIKLRPHMKTAKTLEAGELATNGTKRRICVSTLAEAEFFMEGGFDDIMYAKLFSSDKFPRLQSLNTKLELFHLGVDSLYGCDLLEDNPPVCNGKQWSVFLYVDTGDHREGSLWDADETLEIAKRLSSSKVVKFRGLYTHEGGSYHVRGEDAIHGHHDDTISKMLQLKMKLEKAHIECEDVTVGATPTASVPCKRVKELSEIHPGNYVFYDSMQSRIGSCREEDIACRVATRVVGNYPDQQRLLVDMGWTSAGKDGPLADGSYGIFQDYPHLRLVGMDQEYGSVVYDTTHHKASDFPHGTMLFLYPYHSCNTAACHQIYYIHEGEYITGVWKPCSQW